MKLVSVYDNPLAAAHLYQLLKERDESVNISHRAMPTWDEHLRFVASIPYAAWYLIDVDGEMVGATYLTRQDEIGIFIFRAYQGRGFGKQAVTLLTEAHPRQHYLANINPDNHRSISMFTGMGFGLLQQTYELRK